MGAEEQLKFSALPRPLVDEPEHAVLIANDWDCLDQNDFFRHDCSLAAIAADFEKGGSDVT
ncbi:hypothetical protein DOZ80_09120 [Pseudomonas fluorescens]|uniref:Uncharacterized protein n=1 Tax=Pseudomonas fluorescens TaxID=294 RepID=A0A327N8W1_PSEFL|nr:hypothetical protein DOZ80_09120 [Pseudomonas fluorescens]